MFWFNNYWENPVCQSRKRIVLRDIETTWQELQDVFTRVPSERMEVSGVVESWSVKDLIGHITTWENEAMESLQSYFQHDDIKTLAWPTDLDRLQCPHLRREASQVTRRPARRYENNAQGDGAIHSGRERGRFRSARSQGAHSHRRICTLR